MYKLSIYPFNVPGCLDPLNLFGLHQNSMCYIVRACLKTDRESNGRERKKTELKEKNNRRRDSYINNDRS